MKKTILLCVCLFTLGKVSHGQTVSLTITAGVLANALGTAPEPVGGLLQMIASPSGTFSAPTSTSYVTGDNILLASFAMNYGGGVTGLTANALNGFPLSTANYTLTAGESLLLRFYPSLTYAGAPTAPTLAITYGQVRSSTTEFGPTVDPSETAWVVPAAGSSVDLDYVTVNAGGTYANNSAFATNIVGPGNVPEPSTFVMGWAVIAIAGLWLRKRCQQVV